MLGLTNPIHILFVLMVLLLVFGAKRLPEMGRSLGTGLRGFKETLSGEDNLPSTLAAGKAAPLAATASIPTGPVEDHSDPASRPSPSPD